MIVKVRQINNREQQDRELGKALKILKRKLAKEGVFQVLKQKRYYIKPSEIKHKKAMDLRHKKKLTERNRGKKKR